MIPLSDFNWRDYLERYAVTQERRGGNELVMDCPLCGNTDKKMSVRLDWGRAHCHRCGENPTPYAMIMALEGLGRDRAAARLREYSASLIATSESPERALERLMAQTPAASAAPWEEAVPPPLGPLDGMAQHYLVNRGISLTTAANFGLAVISGGYLSGRLYIPVRQGGRLASWQARKMMELTHGPKYLFPATGGAPVKNCLYNFDNLQPGWIVLTEGVFDAWAVWQNATTQVVASFGKTLTQAQIALLCQPSIKGVYIMLDPDATATALDLAAQLYGVKPVRVCLLDGGDPAEVPRSIAPAMDAAIHYAGPQTGLEVMAGLF